MSRRRKRTRGRRQRSAWYQVGYALGQAMQESILGKHSPSKEWQDVHIKVHNKEGEHNGRRH